MGGSVFQVILRDDLTSVQFLRDGVVIDARAVLTALATGVMTIEYERELGTIGDNETLTGIKRYVKSETWTLVPKEG